MTAADDSACVYRVYDADDRLIYIGASQNLVRRFDFHRRFSWWFELATRVTSDLHPTRAAALAAEAVAIQEEQPAFNIDGTGRAYGDFSHMTAEDLDTCRRWRDASLLNGARVPLCLRDHLSGYSQLSVVAS